MYSKVDDQYGDVRSSDYIVTGYHIISFLDCIHIPCIKKQGRESDPFPEDEQTRNTNPEQRNPF